MIVIKAEYAHLITPFVSTEQARYYLNGLHVEKHHAQGVFIVATDGTSMAVFHDDTGIIPDDRRHSIVSLDKATLKECKPNKKDGNFTRFLVIPDDAEPVRVVLATDALSALTEQGQTVAAQHTPALVDGTFPDWKRIVPDIKPMADGLERCLPVYRASELAKYAKLGPGQTTHVRVVADSENGPGLVLTERKDFFGVTMPTRSNAGETIPDWMTSQHQTDFQAQCDKAA